jgi:hypothetical protein
MLVQAKKTWYDNVSLGGAVSEPAGNNVDKEEDRPCTLPNTVRKTLACAVNCSLSPVPTVH